MIFLFEVEYNGINQICYCNDILYEKLGATYLSPNFRTVDEMISDIDDQFGDTDLWFVQPLPIHQNNPQYNRIKQVFPSLVPITANYSAPETVNIGNLTFYTYKWDDEYYAIQYSPSTIIGNDSIFSKSTHTLNSSPYSRIGFAVYRSDDIDLENKIVKQGAVVKYAEIRIDKNTWVWWYGAFNISTYGSAIAWPIKSVIFANADPYKPGGTSTHGGGGRPFDDTSDPVTLPSLPADPVLNSGFVTMYQMDVLKLNSLAHFLWDESLFDTETWQKVLANPFDAIISLNYIPASPNLLSDRPIQIGNVTTNVGAAPVADQFVQIDCQTLDVEEYGGTYLDYNPYTKVEIYLPYIGFRDLNTDEVMDKTLHLIYNVDIVTGTCVANILVDNTVLYQFTGNCALSIPLTGRDAGKNFAALLSLISAGAVVGAGAYSGTLDAAGAVKAVSATAQAVMGAKRNIQRSGSVSGAAGFMGGQTPYLIITRPRQALPENQNSFTGYPSFVTENLSDLAGFTTIESIHLEGIPGTSAEIAEIESLLSSGVIL